MNVKKFAIAAVAALGLGLTAAPVAQATTGHRTVRCGAPTGWYQNPDEASRKPVQKPIGMVFNDSDLIHHATSSTVENLHPGSYTAYPNPGQPSFFSVEVNGSDGKYGTLRWNPAQHYWEATSQGQQHHDANPAMLADAFPVHLSHHVISFGVGFTANPPGTVTTLVRSVAFAGRRYKLSYRPCTTPGPVPTAPHTKPPVVTPPVTQPGEAPPATPVHEQPNFTG
jgi:hypothetical protein